ncbi:hypothetical protein Rs2_37543 [Raphanus sativus]|nr:hypothetical protein Rs2_37543 [Raphanus sativus]
MEENGFDVVIFIWFHIHHSLAHHLLHVASNSTSSSTSHGWQSRTWTAGLVRKSLLRGGIGPPFDKHAKLRASRDGLKAGRVQNGMGSKRDGPKAGWVKPQDFEDPQS